MFIMLVIVVVVGGWIRCFIRSQCLWRFASAMEGLITVKN